MEGEKKYFKRLDIIRNISCILVFLYHLDILKCGFLAVCTFFCLSGYLSYVSVINKKELKIKDYYIKRFKKLYCPLIIVICSTLIISKLIPNVRWLNLKQETISAIFGYNNFWQLNANLDYFTKNVNSPFIHLWYISILMQFDLIFPIIFKALKKVQEKVKFDFSTIILSILTIIATVFAIVISQTQSLMMVYYDTFTRIFSILFGVLAARVYTKYYNKNFQKSSKLNNVLFIIYTLILVFICVFVPDNSKNYIWYMIAVTIISTLLIKNSITEDQKIGKIDKDIKAFAKISYEAYLIQYPIIFFMMNIGINFILKDILIAFITIISSIVLHLLINFKIQNKKLKKIKIIFLSLIIITGSIIVITEKDHSEEMKELESKLNENMKIAEEKNEQNLEDKTIETDSKKERIEIDESKIKEEVRNLHIVGVGDSVLLSAIDELYDIFPNGYFDGKISRSIISSKELLIDLRDSGKMGDTVIISLANNGDYSDKRNKELMEILGNRKIYWVNAVGADDPEFNDRFREFAKNYSNICIVEWDKAAEGHPEYFYPDGIHPKGEGLKAYANTIYETIYKDHIEKYKINN